jgi:hypothetical protein
MTTFDGSLPPDRLWKGEARYRALSYDFTVRWNWPRAGTYIRRVLDRFAFSPHPEALWSAGWTPPGALPVYGLVDLGPGEDPRYHLTYGDGVMLSSADPGEVLSRFFMTVNLEAFRQTGDFFLVHAGAVATPSGEGVLLPGGSGAGKTTLVAALVRAGFGYLSDEAGAIDPVTRRLYPYPRALGVKKGAFGLFPELAEKNGSALIKHERHVLPERIGPLGGPCHVRFVIAHQYETGATTEVTPIGTAAMVMELARNAWNLGTYGGRSLTLLSEAVRGAKGYKLFSGSLDESVRAVAALTGTDHEVQRKRRAKGANRGDLSRA